MESFINLDRANYKYIKNLDRAQMNEFLNSVYTSGRESVTGIDINTESLRNDLGAIKGIGEARLNEIMAVIDKYLKAE